MYAEFESTLGEYDRARAIFDIATCGGNTQNLVLDMPERIWKAYIDFEIESNEIDRARSLYIKLLEKTKHVKVWASYALFEADQANNIENARNLMEQAQTYFKKNEPDLKEERRMLLENWLNIEKAADEDSEMTRKVEAKLPRQVKKRRKTKTEEVETEMTQTAEQGEQDQAEVGWEEYFDYVFPDDLVSDGMNNGK